jgi:hypothetical protein
MVLGPLRDAFERRIPHRPRLERIAEGHAMEPITKTPGQIAFEAYNEKKGGLTYDGKPIPPWSDVGDAVRAAWEASALAVLHVAYDLAMEEADDQPDEGGTARRVQMRLFDVAGRPDAWLLEGDGDDE